LLEDLADVHPTVSTKHPCPCSLLQLANQIELTSNRQHSPIYTLNDDVLLNIFYLYRLHIMDEEHNKDGFLIRNWHHQRWWYKLAQVSRQWRDLILASPSRLDLHLVCTYGVPVADMLAHSPSLPLTVFYHDNGRLMSAEDEENALLTLSHSDRVRRLCVWMPAERLGKFIAGMGRQFPILGHLSIGSVNGEDSSLILPVTFQAPDLHYIQLWHTALPIRSPLLTSTGGLVCLWLGRIPKSAYFPPSYLLTRLSLIPRLEKLGIIFHPPRSSRDVVSHPLDIPIMTDVSLPYLRVFSFVGASAYLERLLDHMSAPALAALRVVFNDQLTLTETLPWFLQFINTSQDLIYNSVALAFDRKFIHFIADPHRGYWERPLYFRIDCNPFYEQVASIVQILNTLSPVLSAVEKLDLSHVGHNRSPEWHNEFLQTRWGDLLRPFSGVKTLRVHNSLVGGLSRSLRSEGGDMSTELLPNLQQLQYAGARRFSNPFTAFIKARKRAGHPVRLVSRF
jgi:hypothetical protein